MPPKRIAGLPSALARRLSKRKSKTPSRPRLSPKQRAQNLRSEALRRAALLLHDAPLGAKVKVGHKMYKNTMDGVVEVSQ